eukprot:9504140-Pyramimonas_sp.AAC.2
MVTEISASRALCRGGGNSRVPHPGDSTGIRLRVCRARLRRGRVRRLNAHRARGEGIPAT